MPDNEPAPSKFERSMNWIRDHFSPALKIGLIALIVALVLRISWAEGFDLGDFRFTDLLSLLLAVFAIGISVLFYFKATDASNEFYNNTYVFTQKTSELLGRLEERFGGELRHLGQEQGRIALELRRVSRTPGEFKALEKEEREKEAEEGKAKAELEAAISERENELAKLLQKAYKDNEAEKNAVRARMTGLEEQLRLAEQKLRAIEKERDELRVLLRSQAVQAQRLSEDSVRYIIRLLRDKDVRRAIRRGDRAGAKSRASFLLAERPWQFPKSLIDDELVDGRGYLTERGINELFEGYEKGL